MKTSGYFFADELIRGPLMHKILLQIWTKNYLILSEII